VSELAVDDLPTEDLNAPGATSPAATTVSPPISTAAPFYVVGTRKFTVMFLLTYGSYAFYWMYKQWACYRDFPPPGACPKRPWPVPRAVFAPLYFYPLFRAVRAWATPRLDDWEWRTHAVILAGLTIADFLIGVFSDADGTLFGAGSLIMLALPWYFYFKAQQLINVACNDPAGARNATLSKANYAWIALFILLTALIEFDHGP